MTVGFVVLSVFVDLNKMNRPSVDGIISLANKVCGPTQTLNEGETKLLALRKAAKPIRIQGFWPMELLD